MVAGSVSKDLMGKPAAPPVPVQTAPTWGSAGAFLPMPSLERPAVILSADYLDSADDPAFAVPSCQVLSVCNRYKRRPHPWG